LFSKDNKLVNSENHRKVVAPIATVLDKNLTVLR